MRVLVSVAAVVVALLGASLLYRTATPRSGRFQVIKRGEVRLHSLNLPPNHFARVAVHQMEIDLTVEILRPDGTSFGLIDASPFGQETVLATSEAGGPFTVRILANGQGPARGSYQFVMTDLRPATLRDLEALEGQRLFSAAEREGLKNTASGYERALELFAKAAAAFGASGESRGAAHTEDHRGILSDRIGNYEQARKHYLRALSLWESLNDEHGRLESLRRLARLHGHGIDNTQLLPSDDEFLVRWRRLGDRRGVVDALRSLARRSMGEEKYDRALTFQQEALTLTRVLGDQLDEARTLEKLVEVHVVRKQLDAALEVALRILDLVRQMKDERGEAAALHGVGFVLGRANRPRDAVFYAQQALEMRIVQGDRASQASLHWFLGALYRDLGDLSSSITELQQAREIDIALSRALSEPKWRLGFQGRRVSTRTLIQSLMSAGRVEEAFLVADQSLGQLFLEDQKPNIREIAQILDENTALLEYWLEDDGIYLWHLDHRGRLSASRLPPRKEIERLTRSAYESFSRNRVADDALRLSRVLLGPLQGTIAKKRLLIVGDGILHYLPFAALPDPEHSGDALLIDEHEIVSLPAASATLVLRNTRAPESKDPKHLALFADPVFDSRDNRFRAGLPPPVPDPEVTRAAGAVGLRSNEAVLPRLGYSAQEARSILAFVEPGRSVSRFLGFNATREAFLKNAQDHSFVHVSSHGLVNDEDPDLSGVVLSLVNRNGDPIDGFVRLRDLYSFRLPCRLVVLSACKTALGREVRGGGVLGLTGGFFYAGAASVISTAWSVNDEATAELMRLFYEDLFTRRPLRPASSLRAAQLALRDKPRWSSPYYWSGFLFNGEWR